MKTVKIALLGLGNVGRGVWNILKMNEEEIMKRSGYKVEVAKILVRDKNKPRTVEVLDEIVTTDFNEILNDDSIKIVVEVMGGIEPAKDYILKAMSKKKNVVTANKMLIATNGDELFHKADEEGVMINYEASVAGGIPIIQSINESLTANKIEQLYGIVNGTTNFILSKMELEGSGFYAQYKLAILASLAFGTKIDIDKVYRQGITNITSLDMEYAKSLGMVIKLLAIVKEKNGKLELRVHPTMIPETHPLANVYDSFNAVFIKGNAVGDLMFYGRGAGDLPTGSAVVADIISVIRDEIASKENSRSAVKNELWKKELMDISEVESRYYIRLSVEDKPGVLADLTAILGYNKVSLRSVMQKGKSRSADGGVILVLTTHHTTEADVKASLETMKKLESVKSIDNLIRIEDFTR